MHPQSKEIAAFTGNIAPMFFALIQVRPADPNVVTDGDRKAVQAILVRRILGLKDFGQNVKQHEPHARWDRMNPAVQTAFTEHIGDVAMLSEKRLRISDMPMKKPSHGQEHGDV